MTDQTNKPGPKPRNPTEPIAVGLIRFKTPIDVPGRNSASNITVLNQANKERWTVEYLAHMRHFVIVYVAPGGEPSKPRYVHESNVSGWDPL